MAADDGRIDLGYGTLNNIEDQTFGKILDPENTSGFNILRQVASDSFRKNTLLGAGPFKGVVLRVDVNPTNNPINSWLQRINIFSKPRISVKVRIPELHAAMLEPIKYGPNCDNSNHIIDMYPSFIAASDEISNEVPAPGDIVWVDFGNRNNFSEPSYLGIAMKLAQGGAVGRDTGRDKFSDNGKAPLGILPPLGDNPVTQLTAEENQIPGIIQLQPTKTNVATIGDFQQQRDHVDSASGAPSLKKSELAYKSGSQIGTVELLEIPTPIATKSKIFIAKNQERPFYDLINAAKRDKINLQLNSGFRSNEQQKYLYEGWIKRKPGFNSAAKPGYSNHQNGIAFDFATGGHTTKIYEWLSNNGHKFGFYNAGRFFEEKEHWHWEYLGIDHELVIAEGKRPLSEKLKSFT